MKKHAPHVQAAIRSALQSKTANPIGSALADHVRRGIQAKVPNTRPAPAPHVRQAIGANLQPAPGPSRHVSSRPGGSADTVQSMNKKMGVFGSGFLSNKEKKSGWSVYSEIDFGEDEPVKTKSGKLTKFSKENVMLGDFDAEHTHAEDHLIQLIKQQALLLGLDKVVSIPKLYLTSSPCSSKHGTSKKTEGCTETLIRLYKWGVPINDEKLGDVYYVKFQIGTLHAKKLYRPKGVKQAKQKSGKALQDLFNAGVVKKIKIG